MALSLTHTFVSAVADGVDATVVRPSNWNAQHTITADGNSVLGVTANVAGAIAPIVASVSGSVLTLGGGSITFSTTTGITVVGTLTGGATGAGFTVALGTSTITGILGSANGGTANGFTKFTGPSASEKTFTLPNSSQAIAMLDLVDQTVSGGANVTASNQGTKSSGTFTPDCGTCPLQYCVNSGSFTLGSPANDGSVMLLVTNGASAGTITFSGGYTVGSNIGDTLTTTNGNKFTISIWRINGIAGYRIAAHQ